MKHVSAATDSVEVLSLTTASSTFVRTSATLLQPPPPNLPYLRDALPPRRCSTFRPTSRSTRGDSCEHEAARGRAAFLARMAPLPRPQLNCRELMSWYLSRTPSTAASSFSSERSPKPTHPGRYSLHVATARQPPARFLAYPSLLSFVRPKGNRDFDGRVHPKINSQSMQLGDYDLNRVQWGAVACIWLTAHLIGARDRACQRSNFEQQKRAPDFSEPFIYCDLAGNQGFEPWERSHVRRFSRPVHSTTLPIPRMHLEY